MFGRRSHLRFTISAPSEGVLRVLRDVVVQQVRTDELVVISREVGFIGETLTVEVAEQEKQVNMIVRVIESRPVVVDGVVRHLLRLQPVDHQPEA